jgi:predicted Zn-dependent peptidase
VETTQLDEGLFCTTAANGLVVLSEKLPGVRSAAVGIYVRTASAHEQPSQLGISHLLEHMVFKGTERRSAGTTPVTRRMCSMPTCPSR